MRVSPILRITVSLTGILVAVVMMAAALRLLPDGQREALLHRKRTVEALTVTLSTPTMLENAEAIAEVMNLSIERDSEILGMALRDAADVAVVSAGAEPDPTNRPVRGRSEAEFITVPLFAGGEEIGRLDVQFKPVTSMWSLSWGKGGLLLALLFMTVSGAAAFFLVLRRALKAIDPSAVIPERVQQAMNTLVEGVVIMDERQNILLANRAFATILGVPEAQLLGKSVDALNWRAGESGGTPEEFPWVAAMRKRIPVVDQALQLRCADGSVRSFNINASPVLGEKAQVRGAMVSFNDTTELQAQNQHLQQTLTQLEESQRSVEKQNTELQYLATRDALTGCLNRRALFEQFETALSRSRTGSESLWCAMLDIDHFKAINDKFGHGVGDRAIAFVAETIRVCVGDVGFVGRYGGEEFCVVVPNRPEDEVRALLEKVRRAVKLGAATRFPKKMKVAISGGYAAVVKEDQSPALLIDRADTALYAAKNRGRDRVVAWDAEISKSALTETGVHRASKGELTGAWHTARVAALGETGLQPMMQAAVLDVFKERASQSLAVAARHSWTAALLRIEVESSLALDRQASRELLDRITTLLRRSDTLSLIMERGAAQLPEALPNVEAMGPGEIGVLLLDVRDVRAIGMVVQRILKTLSEPLKSSGREAFVSAAVGIAIAPGDGEELESLLSCAAHALRIVRTQRGGERYAFYQASMTERFSHTMKIENGLRLALENNQLELAYQPQLDLATGAVCGMEALLRWTDAEGCVVRPDEFVPIAESSGLISLIGDWVLQKACLQARIWWKTTGVVRRVAVNVSAVQIMSEGYAERVAAILRTTEVEARLIELEITETAFMADLGTAATTLRQLRKLGLHITLDDFGTGYSSLSYLKQLPIDSVKIDSRFVRDLNDTREGVALVNAIVGMAHGLGIRVVAEGVESLDVLALLKRLGCDEAQGYLLSRPVPVGDALRFAESPNLAAEVVEALEWSGTSGDDGLSRVSAA